MRGRPRPNGVGAITPEAYQRCVGHLEQPREPGIHLEGVISFDSQLKAGFGTTDYTFFGITGQAGDYGMLLELGLQDRGLSPLGLHRLDSIWAGRLGAAGSNGAYLAHDTNPFLARTGLSGMVLVAEHTTERTAGLILGLVFQNAGLEPTDYIPYGHFTVVH